MLLHAAESTLHNTNYPVLIISVENGHVSQKFVHRISAIFLVGLKAYIMERATLNLLTLPDIDFIFFLQLKLMIFKLISLFCCASRSTAFI